MGVVDGGGEVLAAPQLSVSALGGDRHRKKGAGRRGGKRSDACIEQRDALEAADTGHTRVKSVKEITLLNGER